MGFPRQEYWSGLPFVLQGIFLTQGLKLSLLHCRQILYHLSLPWKHTKVYRDIFFPGAHSLQLDLKAGWDPRPHWSQCKRKMAMDDLEQTQEKIGLGLSLSSAAYQLIIPERVTQSL